jgi:hypothetical protein
MASLKEIAGCIGLPDSFSVLRGFYGYITGAPKPLSLLEQIRLVQGKHIHLNLIRVGIESFTASDEAEIDIAVQATRDRYATVNLGVGRVLRFFITTDEADGRDNIGSDSEASDLTAEWTVDNDALDVFFVLTYLGDTIGRSAVNGACIKDTKAMSGSVVAIESSPRITGLVIAHEVGHYLGLEHREGHPENLMFPRVPNRGLLTSGQGSTMRRHCFVKRGC